MKLFLISILFIPLVSVSQLQLAPIFSDHMVLQRDQPVHFWGKGVPGNQVLISFSNDQKEVVVNADSSWSIFLKKQKANSVPQSIQIKSGHESIELKNILVGDVWICSGQSNMEWPMSREMHFKDEMKNANQPLIRFYNPPPAGRNVFGVAYNDSINKRLNTKYFYQAVDWQTCDSNTIKPMSAVGYYFAKNIIASENVPIGLINLSIGGAPIETFISREAMEKSKQFAAKVKGNWLLNDHLPAWIRERGMQNIGANKNGLGDDLGLNHAYKPGFAYASGVDPIIMFPVKGVIWYQGESNSLEPERVNEYKDLLHLMIEDYRAKWKKPKMPFYWVQLSSIDTANYQSQYWPQFRDEQRRLLNEVKHGGMAVSSDIGLKNDVHPTNKKEVGARLAKWALNKTYKRNIVPSGPLPKKAIYKDGKIVIHFQYRKNGLKTTGDQPLRGFSIDGKTEIAAMIHKNKIIIPVIQNPGFVYYGWKPFTDANLVNAAQLPASTFKIKVQ